MQELVPHFYSQNALFHKNQYFRMHYFTQNCLLKRLILRIQPFVNSFIRSLFLLDFENKIVVFAGSDAGHIHPTDVRCSHKGDILCSYWLERRKCFCC